MNTYHQCRLALIDLEIDNRVNQKKILDVELGRLYELREDLIAESEEAEQPCKCKKEMFFDD